MPAARFFIRQATQDAHHLLPRDPQATVLLTDVLAAGGQKMEEGGQEESRPRRRARGPRGPYRMRGTPKQLLYLAGLVAGKSKRRAAHDAGYKGCPRRAVADLDRAAFNRAVHEAMEQRALTLAFLMQKVRDGMEATEGKPSLTRAGDVVYAEAGGLADVQLKATQFAADLLGVSSKARQAGEADQPADKDAGNVLVMARKYDQLSDEELEAVLRQMQEAGSRANFSSAQNEADMSQHREV